MTNSLKAFFRSFLRETRYMLINILGLSVGIAAFLLIATYLKSELEYDGFHSNSDRIHRVLYHSITPTNDLVWARSGPGMAPFIAETFPDVEAAVRVLAGKNVLDPDPLVSYGEKQFLESSLFYADADFFQVFTFETVDGSAIDFSDPYAVVITASTAAKYFGESDPIGQVLNIAGQGDYVVRQVIKDIPANSHFHFDLIANLASHSTGKNDTWSWTRVYTYLMLKEGADSDGVEQRLQAALEANFAGRSFGGSSFSEWQEAGNRVNLLLQPLRSIHLDPDHASEFEPGGDLATIQLFMLVALMVLLLACVNFINLSTAQTSKRAREVGVRKSLGATRFMLMKQFIGQAVLSSLLAMLLAIVLCVLVFPYLNAMLGYRMAVPALAWYWIPTGLILPVLLGLMAGAYPAFYLSHFDPARVLRPGQTGQGRKSLLRNALTVLQFAISMGLVVATLTITHQVDYMLEKDRGFANDLLVMERANILGDQTETFKNLLKRNPAIKSVTSSSTVPGSWIGSVSLYPTSGSLADRAVVYPIFTDFDFHETYGFQFVQGRGFSKDRASDSLAVIINEAALKAFGLKGIEGEYLKGWKSAPHPIVGVVKDFNQRSPKDQVEPMVLFVNFFPSMQNMTVSFASDDNQMAMQHIQESWNQLVPDEPLIYSFVDENFNKLYSSELEMRNLFSMLSLLAMGIAALGLYGMVHFIAEQRGKEFAIRKILGATSGIIFRLMASEFGRLMCIAFLIAIPAVYLLMDRWLNGFAYRSAVPFSAILLAGLAVVFITLIAVMGRTSRSALENPVKSLYGE
ncbi:MAG: FtsX-like permease family protein [Roseivirga sp.]|nr:FtsX-like permease family protein [Roseivirga sp.]